MPAMHDDVLNAMNKRLEEKRDAMANMLEFDMTHEECIRLIAPSEHIDILTKAAEVATVDAAQSWMTIKVPATIDGTEAQYINLLMRTHAEKNPPLMPRNPQWQRGQAGQKIIDWMEARYTLGRRFGTAQHVLYALARECDSGSQMRYMWPAVMHLCQFGLHPRMDRWMDKFSGYKAVRHAPAVSRELKSAIQDSGALLTSVALIGDDPPRAMHSEVLIGTYEMGTFALDSANVKRL